jgi:rhodanese-related sulfurtransferase
MNANVTKSSLYKHVARIGKALSSPKRLELESVAKQDKSGLLFQDTVHRDFDARDAGQFAKDHIPGAVNLEWRRVLAERGSIPRDKPVLIYCNTGSLSAQAGFALRVAGYENVRILQGGFDAASKAADQRTH